MPNGFATVKDAIMELKPTEFRADPLARKLWFTLDSAHYIVAVSLEFDEDYPVLWKFDPKQLIERLKSSLGRRITVTRTGFVEGLVG
jgi:hypothetical protein